jgi:hypothetical protein
MGWGTVYVYGKPGFEQEVLDRLEHSSAGFMPGSVSGEQNIALYWVDERTNMRDFKKAIGSEIVFKYRLRFFNTLESLYDFQDQRTNSNDSFTPQEQALIHQMNHWDETHINHQDYKHSA